MYGENISLTLHLNIIGKAFFFWCIHLGSLIITRHKWFYSILYKWNISYFVALIPLRTIIMVRWKSQMYILQEFLTQKKSIIFITLLRNIAWILHTVPHIQYRLIKIENTINLTVSYIISFKNTFSPKKHNLIGVSNNIGSCGNCLVHIHLGCNCIQGIRGWSNWKT